MPGVTDMELPAAQTSAGLDMPGCRKSPAAPGTEEEREPLFNSWGMSHFVRNFHISNTHICGHVSLGLEYAAIRNISAISQLKSRQK